MNVPNEPGSWWLRAPGHHGGEWNVVRIKGGYPGDARLYVAWPGDDDDWPLSDVAQWEGAEWGPPVPEPPADLREGDELVWHRPEEIHCNRCGEDITAGGYMTATGEYLCGRDMLARLAGKATD